MTISIMPPAPRSEADWLVGINATQAISIAAGRGTYSLGRVQTPTLCMVCSRFLENKKFEPQPFWQLSLAVKEGDESFRFSSADRWSIRRKPPPCTRNSNRLLMPL